MASQNDSPDQKPPSPFFDQPASNRTLAIDVEGRRFWVSRELLTAYSPVFTEMLYGDFAEAKKDVINLPEKKATDFEEFLLCLIPTPKVKKIDLTNVTLMLSYADEYQIEDMRQRSIDALMEIVKKAAGNDQRLLKILRIACDYRLIEELKAIVKKCALEIDMEQLKPIFMELPLEVVTALLLCKNEIPRSRQCNYRIDGSYHCDAHKSVYPYLKCMYCNVFDCSKCLDEQKEAVCGMHGLWTVEQDVHDLLDRLAKD